MGQKLIQDAVPGKVVGIAIDATFLAVRPFSNNGVEAASKAEKQSNTLNMSLCGVATRNEAPSISHLGRRPSQFLFSRGALKPTNWKYCMTVDDIAHNTESQIVQYSSTMFP